MLPPGVINVVSGGDELGAWMTSHPVPRKISFTGSIDTGKKVAMSAAPDLKRVTLELGGNDPAIVLDDADPAMVAEASSAAPSPTTARSARPSSGSTSPSRSTTTWSTGWPQRPAAVTVGDGTDAGTKLGPINNAPQFERVGARGRRPGPRGQGRDRGQAMDGPGYFFEPTILTGIDRRRPDRRRGAVRPGPAGHPYRDLDDVVDRANATHFGLSGSVWGADADRAAEVAGRLECGHRLGQHPPGPRPPQPFGGFKWSGIGSRTGPGAWPSSARSRPCTVPGRPTA